MSAEIPSLTGRLEKVSKAARIFTHDPSVRSAMGVALTCWAYGDDVGQLIESQVNSHGSELACGAGCSACCHQNVQVNVFEAIAIADWIRRNLSHDDMSEIAKRAGAIKESASGDRFDSSRISRGESCPCLNRDTRMCLIYDMRPTACRVSYSEDRALCDILFTIQGGISKDAVEHGTPISLPAWAVPATYRSPTEYAAISLSVALVEEVMAYLTKGASNRTKTIGPGILNVSSTAMTLELSKALAFSLGGQVDENLKALVRFKESAFEQCEKVTL